MDNKLQQLTDKIYKEGVEKGNVAADNIIEEAKNEAAKIVAKAKSDAKKSADKAQKEADDLKKTALSELQMASQKVMESLKQEISELIGGEVIDTSVKAATTDVKFVQSAIETAIKNWSSNVDAGMNIIVPEKEAKAITDFFATSAKGVLDKGFTIESANNIKAGFQVAAKDGSYKISFTDDDFIAFFKEFVRPKIATLLFKS
jgi:V/A-type H+-transporting ATPase subunit E